MLNRHTHVLREGEYAQPTYRVRKVANRYQYYISVRYFFHADAHSQHKSGPLASVFWLTFDCRKHYQGLTEKLCKLDDLRKSLACDGCKSCAES